MMDYVFYLDEKGNVSIYFNIFDSYILIAPQCFVDCTKGTFTNHLYRVYQQKNACEFNAN